MSEFSVFEYLYRDASNYKAYGSLLLHGPVTDDARQAFVLAFESGEFFIAEQLGIPPLYAGLWKFSGGRSDDDHVWHSFSVLRPANSTDDFTDPFDSVTGFVSRVSAVKTWNLALSPHLDT